MELDFLQGVKGLVGRVECKQEPHGRRLRKTLEYLPLELALALVEDISVAVSARS